MGISLFSAILIALLFGIHPMRVESVAWITERKDVLFGTFFLLSLILYVDYVKTGKRRLYILSLLLFVFSLLAKIQAVSLPLVLILTDYWFNRKTTKNLIAEKIPYFILSFITGIVGIYFLKQQDSLDAGETFPFFQRIFIGSYSMTVYLIKSVFPYNLSALHPNVKELSGVFYFSILPAISFLYMPIAFLRKNKYLVFGILFFFFNIVFLLQIVGAGQGYLADRFTYIPYIGVFFIFAWLSELVIKNFNKNKNITYTIIGIYMVFLTALTVRQRETWKSSETLWVNVLKYYPDNSDAYLNLGQHFRQLKNSDKALEFYDKAIRIEPTNRLALNNRANIFFDRGEFQKAISDYNVCLDLDSMQLEATANRGIAFSRTGNWNSALSDLNKVLEMNPEYVTALSNRAYVFFQTGQFRNAIDDYSNYLKIKPESPDIYNSLGLTYSEIGDYEKAIQSFDKSIEINSKQPVYYINRSLVWNAWGNKQNALNDVIRAQQLGFEVEMDYLNMLQN